VEENSAQADEETAGTRKSKEVMVSVIKNKFDVDMCLLMMNSTIAGATEASQSLKYYRPF
jgi:hypothetical protein